MLFIDRFGKFLSRLSLHRVLSPDTKIEGPKKQIFRLAISRCHVTRGRKKKERKEKRKTSPETVKRKRTNLVTVYSISFIGGGFSSSGESTEIVHAPSPPTVRKFSAVLEAKRRRVQFEFHPCLAASR